MFLDDYSLDKSLGKGAFGEVFLTTKKGTKEIFATKKIERELAETGNTMKYLVNEINILKELNHPNIVKLKEIKKTKNHYYIIMEYCNGGELYKTLEKYMNKYNKPFSEEIVQHLMKQIINAFKYIHGKNIIHRDIKLENILLNYESEEDRKNLNILKAQVKIIDFGFATKIENSQLKYTTLGSPINMDPIILNELKKRGKKTRKLGYDQKADIWSLGTICYEMLIGKCVFNAEDLDELVEKVENGSYTVPTTLSKEVISFLNGMLQYDANTRLNIDQLSKHCFLNKKVKNFEPIDMKKVSKNVDKSRLTINVKKNKSIWAIFNEEDEKKLLRISAQEFDKPISEEGKANDNLNNNNKNNTPNMNKNILPNMQNKNPPNSHGNNIQNNNNLINNKNNVQNNNNLNNNRNNNNRNINPNNNINNNRNINPNNNINNNRNINPNNNINNNRNINPNNNNKNNNQGYYNKINSNNIRMNEKQNPPFNNQYKRADSVPMANLPYGYIPQNYGAMPGYPGFQAIPMQPMQPMQGGMVAMPVMGYPQMQPVQGYAIPGAYTYKMGY